MNSSFHPPVAPPKEPASPAIHRPRPNPVNARRRIPILVPIGREKREVSANAFLVVPLVLQDKVAGHFWENLSVGTTTEPQAGVATTVYADILNRGEQDALNVQVDFRWANSTTGFAESQLQKIGLTSNVLIRSGAMVRVECASPFVPPALAAGAHPCLMVTCWSLNDLGFLKAWQPQSERRCGQRNLFFTTQPPNSHRRLVLDFPNVLPFSATHRALLQVETVLPPAGALRGMSTAALQRRVLAASVAGRTRTGPADYRLAEFANAPDPARWQNRSGLAAVRSQLSESVGVIGFSGARRAFANRLLDAERGPGPDALLEGAQLSTLHEVSLRPFELRCLELELEVPAEARPGEFIVYRVIQMAAGLVLGGYTTVIQVATPHVY